jgi:hypothetical protein
VKIIEITLCDMDYGWDYVWQVLHESLTSDSDPADPTVFMILNIIHRIKLRGGVNTYKFSEVEVFAIIWVLRRWQRWVIGDEAAEVRLLYNIFRKALCEYQSI